MASSKGARWSGQSLRQSTLQVLRCPPPQRVRWNKWTSTLFFSRDFLLADCKPKVRPGDGAMTGGAGNARAPHSYTSPLGTSLSVQGGRKCLRSNRKVNSSQNGKDNGKINMITCLMKWPPTLPGGNRPWPWKLFLQS